MAVEYEPQLRIVCEDGMWYHAKLIHVQSGEVIDFCEATISLKVGHVASAVITLPVSVDVLLDVAKVVTLTGGTP